MVSQLEEQITRFQQELEALKLDAKFYEEREKPEETVKDIIKKVDSDPIDPIEVTEDNPFNPDPPCLCSCIICCSICVMMR